MERPFAYFSNIRDPRVERTREHSLEDILFISIASILCGAESWNEMEEFGHAPKEWLQTFLRLPNGIPSHDTFNRVFSALDPQELEKSFVSWTQAIAKEFDNEVVDSFRFLPVHSSNEQLDSGHGRIETRKCSKNIINPTPPIKPKAHPCANRGTPPAHNALGYWDCPKFCVNRKLR